MFCDLVGSTQLADEVDPEEVQAILRSYHRVAGQAVARNGGMVSRYQGDGLFVYFGYPTAADDDAVRAVEAGLQVVEDVARLGGRIGAGHLAVRVGIDTGLVVVGEMGWGSRLEPDDVVGDTPNIASRVESLATPGTVLVSERTWHLVEGYFDGRDLGFQQLRGVERPIRLMQITGRTAATDRADLPLAGARLVGRDTELARLGETLAAISSAGGVLAVVGEAGIGKSRLLNAAVERLGLRDVARARCAPVSSSTPFHPLARTLGDELARLETLARDAAALARAGTSSEVLAADVSLVAAMIGRRQAGADEADRRRRHEAIVRTLRASGHELWVIEDADWADPGTLDVIVELAASPGGTALALTAPRLPPALAGLPVVEVGALDPDAVRALVGSLAGRRRLSNTTVNAIVARCGGNPLFIEEVVREALEARDDLSSLEIVPTTLQDSLMGRVDRLGPYKETAQRCAVLGTTFSEQDVPLVCDGTQEELDAHMTALVQAGVLARGPEGFEFRQRMLHDVAYESLLKSTRRKLHGQVAAHLDTGAGAGLRHEVRAFHYQEAGMREMAVEQWRRAARRAARLSDFPEALRHVREGLQLLDAVEPGLARDRDELDFLHSRALALGLVGQSGRVELKRTLERAIGLADGLGNAAKLLSLLLMLITVEHGFGDYDRASALVERASSLSERPELAAFTPLVQHMAGATLLWQGRVTAALPSLLAAAHAVAAYDATMIEPGTASLAASALCSAGLAEWLAARGDGAAWFARAREIAVAAQAPQSLCMSLATESVLHQIAGDLDAAAASARAALAVGAESGNTWDEWAELIHWWTESARSGERSDVEALAQCLATSDAGRQHLRPYFLGLLGERLLAIGDESAADRTVSGAIALARRNGEGFFEAELLRLQADLQAHAGHADRAAATLREAVALAELQGTKRFEQRSRAALTVLVDTSAPGLEDRARR